MYKKELAQSDNIGNFSFNKDVPVSNAVRFSPKTITEASEINYRKFLDLLANINRPIVLVRHTVPDVDANSSCLGMYKLLKALNKTVYYYDNGKDYSNYETEHYKKEFDEIDKISSAQDLQGKEIFMLDVGDIMSKRLVPADVVDVVQKQGAWMIDHHESFDPSEKFIKKQSLVGKEPAAALMVLKLITEYAKKNQEHFDIGEFKDVIRILMHGIYTDSFELKDEKLAGSLREYFDQNSLGDFDVIKNAVEIENKQIENKYDELANKTIRVLMNEKDENGTSRIRSYQKQLAAQDHSYNIIQVIIPEVLEIDGNVVSPDVLKRIPGLLSDNSDKTNGEVGVVLIFNEKKDSVGKMSLKLYGRISRDKNVFDLPKLLEKIIEEKNFKAGAYGNLGACGMNFAGFDYAYFINSMDFLNRIHRHIEEKYKDEQLRLQNINDVAAEKRVNPVSETHPE